MTHAEQYSTSEPSASPARRKPPRKRLFTVLALAASLGVTSAVISFAHPVGADQLSAAKAEAAAVTAQLQGIQAQQQSLAGQMQAADYHLSQLQSAIAANQKQVAKDQAEVTKDQGQLRTQAISDYTDSGTSNQVTQMFSSNPNTSGIRSEYSSIATGNVTTTIDNLHTAQTQLEATQAALQQQQTAATTTRNNLQGAENSAQQLSDQYKATLNSVNAQIQADVIAQQQAAAAAAQKAPAEGQTVADTTGGGSTGSAPVAAADPPPVPAGVQGAIEAAESQLGVPYVWGGETPGVGFDCSGLVQWSFSQAGISLPRTSGAQFAATTQIPLADIEPGDLLFYGPDGSEHVALYIGGGTMIEAPFTGASVRETGVRTGDGFAGVGRVG
jgi:cell wall-associated NlpC family hydrolase